MEKTNKEKILNALEVLRIRDLQSGDPKNKFSALAYSKAIKELKTLKSIESIKDVEDIKGVGKKIKEKIEEILETGQLEAATRAKSELKIDVYQDLLKIHGVGPSKAKELIEKHSIKSVDDLQKRYEKEDLLNDIQKKGLKYYDDSLERIPREEMIQHEKKILSVIKKPMEAIIVGSYRRKAESSGDIDVLIKAPESYSKKKMKETFESIVKAYQDSGYMIDILGLGEKKCMAYVKLDSKSKVRRLDLLITPEKEYPYAILYFTGSDLFNVAFRKYVLSRGYTINEHTMKPKLEDVSEVPIMKSEEHIFEFLNLQYVEPSERKDQTSIIEKTEKAHTKSKVSLKNIVEKKKKNILSE
jgi:DNA polymerase beta